MPRVSIVIPAWNAAATIGETLASATAQTMRDIEVIVVADGCTDDTVDRAARLADADPRIRVIEQDNAGVAVARNRGIAAATGAFVAPLDADDLWHPEKLAMQLRRFEGQDARLGLVYNWYRPIDGGSRVCGQAAGPSIEGWVLHRHLHWNFVGNGSTPLIRREALDGLSYEPALRAAGAGGCEDYLLQLQIATRWRFGCVPAWLTGYRQLTGAMSGNRVAMMRSHVATFRALRPGLPPSARRVCDASLARFEMLSASAGLRRGQAAAALAAFTRAIGTDPGAAAAAFLTQIGTVRRAATRRDRTAIATAGEPFLAADPLTPSLWVPSPELEKLARLDAGPPGG